MKSVHISGATLVLANCIPIFGVIFLDWLVLDLVLLYWLESAVIGLYAVVKMGVSSKSIGEAALFIPFFVVHFGGFMVGHLLAIMAFFGNSNSDPIQQFSLATEILAVPALALFFSHGVSFFVNFIGNKEYRRYTGPSYMGVPYMRVIATHIAIFAGAWLTKIFPDVVFLVIVVAIKTWIDLFIHKREHRKSH